jgi:hypothetical protein
MGLRVCVPWRARAVGNPSTSRANPQEILEENSGFQFRQLRQSDRKSAMRDLRALSREENMPPQGNQDTVSNH